MKVRHLAETLPNGYKPFTTFFEDLDIANQFGKEGVRDTYNRVCEAWLGSYKYFTEFVLCLNLQCWDRYETYGEKDELARLYSDLYYLAKDLLYDHYEQDEEAIEYIFNVLE